MREEPVSEITLQITMFLDGRCLATPWALSRNQRMLAEVGLPLSSLPLGAAWLRNVIHLALQSGEASMEKALGKTTKLAKHNAVQPCARIPNLGSEM